MSTSRAKQKSQGRITKTKKRGNGSKRGWARKKKMKKGSTKHWDAKKR